MTFRDVLGSVLRRWYALTLVLAACAYLTYTREESSGSYVSDTAVTFTLPARSTLLPYSGTNDSSVIAFASAIADEINAGESAPQYATADAPFYGAGLRQGVSAGVPNYGGQHAVSYSAAVIEIKIVGRTPDWVEERQRAVLGEIDAAVRGQQSTTSRSDRISTTIEPLSRQIFHVTPSRSSQLMAFAAMGMAGLIAGSAIATMLDGLTDLLRRWRVSTRGRRLKTTASAGAMS